MKKYRFLIIGAHPDDPDVSCGGLAVQVVRNGHDAAFLSVTDGGAGHQSMSREAIAARRQLEMAHSAQIFGIPYYCLGLPDGLLEASLENRMKLLRFIRTYQPDVIITHRVNDYHPDHRATGQLVMDCSYMAGVPLVCPDVPPLRYEPVILSMEDSFTRPLPFQADIVVPISEDVTEIKIAGSLAHISQYLEWLPWIDHREDIENAGSLEEKKAMHRQRMLRRFTAHTAQYADRVPAGTRYVEAYQIDEYGGEMTDEIRDVMLGKK
ncbi:MAG: PIG-L family deacetylase [Clostridiales bacterium]|nr:PIG-L family deacetylase [Clostridiales bacterium]